MATVEIDSVAQRLIGNEKEIVVLMASRLEIIQQIEDAAAVGDDRAVASLQKDRDRVRSSLEIAESAKRGLARLRTLEIRNELQRNVEDAIVQKTQALARFFDLVTIRDAAAVTLADLERETIAAGLARDSAANRVFNRQKTLAAFVATNSETLSRADQIADASPAELEKIA